MAEPDLHIGGGDDWMPLDYDITKDHDAVGPTVGSFSTCKTCGGGIVIERIGPDEWKWFHVKKHESKPRSVKLSVSVPHDTYVKAQMIADNTSPSVVIQLALNYYVEQNTHTQT